MGKDNVKYINYLKDEIEKNFIFSCRFNSILAEEKLGLVMKSAAGVPSIGFENTGVSEIILHKKSGYLAKENNIDDFVAGIEWFFEDELRFKELGLNAREHVIDNFIDKLIAKKYINIYQNILNIKNK